MLDKILLKDFTGRLNKAGFCLSFGDEPHLQAEQTRSRSHHQSGAGAHTVE
jgi:hypothetical protein